MKMFKPDKIAEFVGLAETAFDERVNPMPFNLRCALDIIAYLQAENARLVDALLVCRQTVLEVQHAQSSGAEWYTKGRSGLYQQVRHHLGLASAAIRAALAGKVQP